MTRSELDEWRARVWIRPLLVDSEASSEPWPERPVAEETKAEPTGGEAQPRVDQ